MSGPSVPSTLPRAPRPTRRRVRVRAVVTAEGQSFDAFSRNISETGTYLFVRKDTPTPELAVGASIRVHLDLPDDRGVVECPAQISWTDPGDLDVDGSEGVGLGVQLDMGAPELAQRLRAFVDDFRYAVLTVGGDEETRGGVVTSLLADYDVMSVREAKDAFPLLERGDVAVLVLLPDGPGRQLELLERVNERLPRLHTVRVVLSGAASVEELRALVNRGRMFRNLSVDAGPSALREAVQAAIDRYAIDVESERLASELERVKRSLERENSHLRQRLTGAEGFDKIIGHSPQLQEALRQIERIRRSDAAAFVHGETGTGKELVARALHTGGPRAERAYVAQNCAGLTDTLLQSTLFGHKKGAFTGADRDHRGLFLEADGGTLFLDEVAELSAATQAMLLRALQEGEIFPVGASRPSKVDVRVVSASHKDLRDEVRAGRFREDLLYRLVVVTIELPPLRERQGDVALLSRHFLDQHCEAYGKNVPGFRPAAMAALEAYAWPGNVRELDNEIERAVILAEDGHKIDVDILSSHVAALVRVPGGAARRGGDRGYDAAVEDVERALVAEALRAEKGSVTRAAVRLKMERTRLGKIRRRLGID